MLQVAQMRVINECSGTPQREVRDEGIGRSDHWSNVARRATPTGDVIGVALQLDAVPVHGSGLLEPVVHHYVSRLTPREHEG